MLAIEIPEIDRFFPNFPSSDLPFRLIALYFPLPVDTMVNLSFSPVCFSSHFETPLSVEIAGTTLMDGCWSA